MTLEKEIERVRRWAKMQDKMADIYSESGEEDRARRLRRSAKENKYIADRLEEAQAFRQFMKRGAYAWIGDKIYAAEHPKLKTIHGKTGEVVIGGFKEVDNGN